jgi:hypothetical protein
MGLTHLHRQGEDALGSGPGKAIPAADGSSGQEQLKGPRDAAGETREKLLKERI